MAVLPGGAFCTRLLVTPPDDCFTRERALKRNSRFMHHKDAASLAAPRRRGATRLEYCRPIKRAVPRFLGGGENRIIFAVAKTAMPEVTDGRSQNVVKKICAKCRAITEKVIVNRKRKSGLRDNRFRHLSLSVLLHGLRLSSI